MTLVASFASIQYQDPGAFLVIASIILLLWLTLYVKKQNCKESNIKHFTITSQTTEADLIHQIASCFVDVVRPEEDRYLRGGIILTQYDANRAITKITWQRDSGFIPDEITFCDSEGYPLVSIQLIRESYDLLAKIYDGVRGRIAGTRMIGEYDIDMTPISVRTPVAS